MRRLRKFLAHDWTDRLLLLEALAWLCWVKFLLVCVPFRWIAPYLGRRMVQSPATVPVDARAHVVRISWAVQSVARRLPLGFVCLPQAIAAKWMLRRRRLASTLYLGLARPEEARLSAHAWLRAGDRILTGRAESLTHSPIATFAEEWR